jgi:hypothetical protein
VHACTEPFLFFNDLHEFLVHACTEGGRVKENLNLDRLLGRREAFSVVAGRCTAAEAAQLREIRDKKLYLERAADWAEFCAQDLHMSKDSANRMIRNLEEFGPTYFVLAQLTQVSPTTYRAIAPSIHDEKLHHNGEAIALIPENAEKVAAAVAELRKTVTVKAPPPDEDVATMVARECSELAGKIELTMPIMRYREQLRAAVYELRDRINRIEVLMR